MSVNRYRLRHKARTNNGASALILRLLKRPDRLLGTILIGNTVANVLASSLATLLAINFLGPNGVWVAATLLTLAILVFAEVAPKTFAAHFSYEVSSLFAKPIMVLQKIFYPLIWLVNTFANGFLYLFRVNFSKNLIEPLSRDELRSVVFEATGKVPSRYQSMLLGILDLNKVTVDGVMIPQHEILGIDLNDSFAKIIKAIANSKHEFLPVYRENINQVVGVLHVRNLVGYVLENDFDKTKLIKMLEEPYFIPEGTLLNVQLQNFQAQKKRIALVVDEYGEIQGLLTPKIILEEIVGEFTSGVTADTKQIVLQKDGSYLINGASTMRDINRTTSWEFPTDGPRTLNGLVMEHLESIPKIGVCLKIADYPIEIIDVKENCVKIARVYPRLRNVIEE